MDQVEAISKLATPETEVSVIEDALGWSQSELERRARHSEPSTVEEARSVWARRRLVRQWNLDSSELKFWGNLPSAAGEMFDTAIQDGVAQIPVNPETGGFDPVETRALRLEIELAERYSAGLYEWEVE